MSFNEWCDAFAYIGPGVEEGTNEDAAYDFFNHYLSPWVTSYGYKWNDSNMSTMTKKFTRLAYAMYCADKHSKYSVTLPNPPHRNLQEDRDTFDHLIGLSAFADFCEAAAEAYPPVSSRESYSIYEFCYTFINPEAGPPGTYTQRVLDEMAHDSDDDQPGSNRASNSALPDAYANRRKHDLY
jgi:hypothetical protein